MHAPSLLAAAALAVALPATALAGDAPKFPPDHVPVALELREALHPEIDRVTDAELRSLVALYQDLHRRPELSNEEKKTARRMAKELRGQGYAVTPGVGGTGVVAVLKNGAGPVLLIRADMDALPVQESTGLRYASKSGVMHACGHDVHMSVVAGTARVLKALKSKWRGTVVVIMQPAEELGMGAKQMIEDGLFERFGTPDAIIGEHVSPELPAGTVGLRGGWVNANVDSVDITIFGRGGHGARPHQAIDPVVTASQLVMNLQTLVSRRVPPIEDAVVTVGSIHGGTKHNIIPDEVKLQLTVRSYTDAVRETLIEGIRQITADTCRVMQCPKPPKVELPEELTPAAYNHQALAAGAKRVFTSILGANAVRPREPSMGGEDFGRYSRHSGRPGFMFRLGTQPPELFDAEGAPKEPLPSLHSAKFAPVPRPTLRTGVRAMSALALALLGVE